MNLFIAYLQTDPFYYVTSVFIIMFSICVHECAHAWVALRQGDSTAAWLGHISLNPRIQMGWQSMVVMLLFGMAWGKVPYNPRNFRNAWSGALMAFAGPLANLVLSFVAAGLACVAFRFMSVDSDENMVFRFFLHASSFNAMLFIFNMMPLPILDGWKVMSLFIPEMARVPPHHASNISMLGIFFLWSTASGLLWNVSYVISDAFFDVWHLIF